MTTVTAAMVKQLRDATGAGPLDCKKALEAHEGNLEAAQQFLREKGMARADRKLGAGREMNEGIVASYQHFTRRLAVLVEVNCETDFVAKTEVFQQFAYDIALQIANMNPQFVREDDIPSSVREAERSLQQRILSEDAKHADKPPAIQERIVEGRLEKWYEEVVLMRQRFIKDESQTIADLLKETVSELGESIRIRRFVRFEVGEATEAAS